MERCIAGAKWGFGSSANLVDYGSSAELDEATCGAKSRLPCCVSPFPKLDDAIAGTAHYLVEGGWRWPLRGNKRSNGLFSASV